MIIIDEISMVGTKQLHYINYRLQQIFKSDKLFAGIPFIVLGDFKQLPPVGDSWIFNTYNNEIYSSLIGNPLWELFKYYELTEIMRQKDDLVFAKALNNLGEGCLTQNDITMFQSRVREISEVPSDAIHLFVTNEEVEHYNNIKINSVKSIGYASIAIDTVSGNISLKQKENILKNLKDIKSSETYGLSSDLLLKVGLKFMLTTNTNTRDGLANGAVGILKRIECRKKGDKNIPFRLWLDFENKNVGKNTRMKYNVSDGLTPIDLCTKSFQYKNKRDIKINRRQFPIKCAEAMTIHKSQGSTYFCVCIHINKKKCMSNASFYVA